MPYNHNWPLTFSSCPALTHQLRKWLYTYIRIVVKDNLLLSICRPCNCQYNCCNMYSYSGVLPGAHADQDLRTGGRNADVSFAKGLVTVGPAKRPHRQVALPGHLPVSAHQSVGWVFNEDYPQIVLFKAIIRYPLIHLLKNSSPRGQQQKRKNYWFFFVFNRNTLQRGLRSKQKSTL